jgi:ribosome-associated protein
MLITEKDIIKFKAVRSSGPGGQRVNRRSTKVQLWVKISDLPLSERDKKKIRQSLAHHINHKDELWVYDQEERSQELNKDKALARLNQMIVEALKEPPPRLPAEPRRSTKEVRIKEKKIKSQKKRLRRLDIRH